MENSKIYDQKRPACVKIIKCHLVPGTEFFVYRIILAHKSNIEMAI